MLQQQQQYAFKDPNLNPECTSEWPWSLSELQISMLAMAAQIPKFKPAEKISIALCKDDMKIHEVGLRWSPGVWM